MTIEQKMRKALAEAELPMDLNGFTPEQEKWIKLGLNGMIARLRTAMGVESLAALVEKDKASDAPGRGTTNL